MLSTKLLSSKPILSKGFVLGKQAITTSSIKSFSQFFPCTKANTTNKITSTNTFICQRRLLSSNSKSTSGKKTTSSPKEQSTNTNTDKNPTTFLQRWLGPKEIPPRGTLKWYGEMTLLCTVFAITGTSTMVLVRPAMSEVLGLKGSLKDGPWSYRICSIVIMTPLYSAMLVFVGTIFGRHFYFRHFAVKMFSRFGIPPELMDKSFHETAKNFRKY